MKRAAKTSEDIMRERDSLALRVQILEAAIHAVERETQDALRHPELGSLALGRISSLAAASGRSR